MASEDMVLDAVDEADTPIGVVRRNDVFRTHTNFRVVHVLVFNAARMLLIQQLALDRSRHPGYWGSSVAAYLYANEGYADAAKRRCAEELGVLPAELKHVGQTVMDDNGCRKFIGVFTSSLDGPFQFDRHHIAALEFLPVELIHRRRLSGERVFTPTFLHVLDFYESKLHTEL